MAQRNEITAVYVAAVIQGLALVTFPAASTVFTSPQHYGLSSTEYGSMFVPQAIMAISASLLGAGLIRRLGIKRIYLLGLAANLVSMTEAQFLASKQPTAIQVAVSRGQFEMNCPNATGEVLSQELTQPPIQGPLVQGESRGLFTIGVAGCGQRRVYQVFCPMGGDSCTALEGQTS